MTYETFKKQYQVQLNTQQEKAVQAVNGCTLLLAVPGSGKTTVLVTRLGYMVFGCGVLPESILTMTYTVAATRDMRSRFTTLFGEKMGRRLEFRTINGVSARIIRTYERHLNRQAFSLISDEKELSNLIGEIYRKVLREFPTESEIKAVRTMITYAKNQMLSSDEIGALAEMLPGFPEIYWEYNKILKEQCRMDYDDQMVYAYQILRKFPQVLKLFQSQYQYICVDEAQDTSKIQHKIIELLVGSRGNLFMVGDEDQSIYGFRAAYPEALLEFEHVYDHAKVLLMEQNYRSTKQIVAASDKFIQQNESRHPKHMYSAKGCGREVQELSVYARKGQYAYLLSTAKTCDRETAVLYRENDCALPLIDLLERQGIPYRCRQMDGSFFTHRITQDISDIIRFSQDQTNCDIFLHIYYKFCAGITRIAAESAIKRSGGTRSLFDLLCSDSTLSEWTRSKCKALKTHLINMQNERADKAIYRISHFMGYNEYLQTRKADTGRLQILEALGAQEPNPVHLLMRLEELRTIITQKISPQNCNFILSTIHSSKGLEYDRVILMDIIDGISPKTGDDVDLDEERRIFYVAMTRAKKELSIFTFKNNSCISQFSDSVFGKKDIDIREQQSIHTYSKQTQLKSSSSVYRSPTQSGKSHWAIKDYIPGRKVRHKAYGQGTVKYRENDLIIILFDDGSEKQFLLSAVLQAKALKLL